MKVSGMLGADLEMAPLAIAQLESQGYDEAFSAEINNEPFFPLVLAAEHSKTIALSTSISVAFARNPMTMANLAWDLNQYAKGRFTLGIGSQIQAHISKRFSMPWSKPAARMREFIQAMQSIWSCWESGGQERLQFRGEFYQHTLMTPMFVPGKCEFGAPQVRLAGVGPLMTEVAGEVADGLIAHGFSTAQYMREVTLPAVERGLAIAGRAREGFDISSPIMVVSGTDEESFQQNKQAVKTQLAFYGSTPAYKPVLDLHGWGDLQGRLNTLSKEGKWVEMGELIDDDILNTFAVVCENPGDIAANIKERYQGLVDTWQCTFMNPDADLMKQVIQSVQHA
jgi:probable F420-dependent oxidoreductase